MKTVKLYIFLILVIAAAAVGVYFWWNSSQPAKRVDMTPAAIKEVRSMADLLTVEFTEDVPVRGHVGTRHLFGAMTVKGSVSFPLDSMKTVTSGDSIRVTVPRERIEILESTAPDSYRVFDTWNDEILGSANITVAEENRMKQLAAKGVERRLRSKGIVKRARHEAAVSIASHLSAATGRHVTVTILP